MNTTPEMLRRLHPVHMERYTKRLARARAGEPGFRETELIQLVKLWKEVEEKGFDFSKLSTEAKVEVMDAIADTEG